MDLTSEPISYPYYYRYDRRVDILLMEINGLFINLSIHCFWVYLFTIGWEG